LPPFFTLAAATLPAWRYASAAIYYYRLTVFAADAACCRLRFIHQSRQPVFHGYASCCWLPRSQPARYTPRYRRRHVSYAGVIAATAAIRCRLSLRLLPLAAIAAVTPPCYYAIAAEATTPLPPPAGDRCYHCRHYELRQLSPACHVITPRHQFIATFHAFVTLRRCCCRHCHFRHCRRHAASRWLLLLPRHY